MHAGSALRAESRTVRAGHSGCEKILYIGTQDADGRAAQGKAGMGRAGLGRAAGVGPPRQDLLCLLVKRVFFFLLCYVFARVANVTDSPVCEWKMPRIF